MLDCPCRVQAWVRESSHLCHVKWSSQALARYREHSTFAKLLFGFCRKLISAAAPNKDCFAINLFDLENLKLTKARRSRNQWWLHLPGHQVCAHSMAECSPVASIKRIVIDTSCDEHVPLSVFVFEYPRVAPSLVVPFCIVQHFVLFRVRFD